MPNSNGSLEIGIKQKDKCTFQGGGGRKEAGYPRSRKQKYNVCEAVHAIV